jgi:hypothetical protein
MQENPESLLCLDVSSTALGWAHFVLPLKTRPGLSFAAVKAGSSSPALERIAAIVQTARNLIRYLSPDVILMEMTDGRSDVARSKARGGAVAGLAVLGQAQGAVWQMLQEEIERQWERQRPELVIVHENVWTAGQKPEVRAANIALEFPSYKEYQKYDEPGLDAADAIGMGLWWIGQQKIEAALKAVEPAAPQGREVR